MPQIGEGEPRADRRSRAMGSTCALDLLCEGSIAPECVDSQRPLLRWRLRSSDGVRQVAYQLRVERLERATLGSDAGAGDQWDSGRVASNRSLGVAYEGPTLEPHTRYRWTVRAWDDRGGQTEWADPAHFRTGRLSGGRWDVPWVSVPADVRLSSGDGRAFYFGRKFAVNQTIASAYLYATAMGVYQVTLNGAVASLGEQTPGWTPYEKRFHYQVADVAHLVREGANHLVVLVADGWWAGNVAWWGRHIYGDHTAVSLELRLSYTNGTEEVIRTGPEWRAATGRLVQSDLLMGDAIDLRLPGAGEASAALREELSVPVAVEAQPFAEVVAQPHAPVRAHEAVPPVLIRERSPGSTVIDFGRSLTGRVRLRLRGERGTVVALRHAEALKDDGSLYRANLRTARQEDRFVLSGEDDLLEPCFALHGFRYVEVCGYGGAITSSQVEAQVVHSDLEAVGSLRTAQPMVNQLQECIVWSQRGNFIDIPLDCAQRDERLGWSGDINLFASTALYNMDCGRFLTSWLTSLADGQLPNGSVPDIAPYTREPLPPRDINEGQPGWGDAIVCVPWEIYLHTGDDTVMRRLWGPMARWVDHLVDRQDGLIREGGVFGDWNAVDRRTPTALIGTYWFARAAGTIAKVAAALGREADTTAYTGLYRSVRSAFVEQFIGPEGYVAGESQTAFALALDLVPEPELRGRIARHLVQAIAADGWHITTGFVGTSRLLPVLCDAGYADVAYRLLAQTSYPSWGFMLANGATALWEHWDSWAPGKGFHDPRMNSFNHFALGSVGAWLYGYAAGINPDPEKPGYQRVIFRPYPDTYLGELRAQIDSPAGSLVSSWWTDGRKARISVVVPDNCEAELELPWASDEPEVLEGDVVVGEQLEGSRGVPSLGMGPGAVTILVAHPARDSQQEWVSEAEVPSNPSRRAQA